MSDRNDFQEENSTNLQVDHHQGRDTLNDESFFLAGFWMRFWAYLIDLIVVASIGNLLVKPIFRLLDVSIEKDGMFAPMAITGAIIFYGYFVLMTKFLGQTLGKMVFGLRVTNIKGSDLGWSTILFRELIGRFISSYMFILYVVVAFTPRKQGIHDLFADTTVIQERKTKILKPAH